MESCPNVDALLAVGQALQWETTAGLEHLKSCERCQQELESLHAIHASLVDEVEPAAGYVDAVVRSLAEEPASAHAAGGWVAVLNPILAAAVGMVVALNAVTPEAEAPLRGIVVSAAFAAVAAVYWGRRPEPVY